MDNLQKSLLIALISISGLSWFLAHTFQLEMMSAMMVPYNPFAVSVFVAVWTAGMAAMMFPAISPVVLLYNRLARSGGSGNGTLLQTDSDMTYHLKMVLFVGSYLAVWSATGLALFAIWSVLLGAAISGLESGALSLMYGAILVAAGAYQFSPLKSKCLGYCESPMSLFMRRWRKGVSGAVTMGTYHGLYCLGCCWPYFLIMVALGWMNVAWMALFAGVIFGEKVWSRGIWVARAAGIGLGIAGALAMTGTINIAPDTSMTAMADDPMPEMTGGMTPGAEMNGQVMSEDQSQAPPSGASDESGMETGDGSPGMGM